MRTGCCQYYGSEFVAVVVYSLFCTFLFSYIEWVKLSSFDRLKFCSQIAWRAVKIDTHKNVSDRKCLATAVTTKPPIRTTFSALALAHITIQLMLEKYFPFKILLRSVDFYAYNHCSIQYSNQARQSSSLVVLIRILLRCSCSFPFGRLSGMQSMWIEYVHLFANDND